MISHGVEISIAGGGADEKDEGNRGRSLPYIAGNPSTVFAARLIPQYESHIRGTKETIQFVVNLTKEIPHSNRVTKERTPKLSQHVSHQGTVRAGPSPGPKSPEAYSGSSGNGPGLRGYRSWNSSTVLSLLIDSAGSHVVSS